VRKVEDYERNLEVNLQRLHARIHSGQCWPKPVRRTSQAKSYPSLSNSSHASPSARARTEPGTARTGEAAVEGYRIIFGSVTNMIFDGGTSLLSHRILHSWRIE
jgi:hypothetical protein